MRETSDELTIIKKGMEQIERLKAENERLKAGMQGMYDLDAWLDWALIAEQVYNSHAAIKEENEKLRKILKRIIRSTYSCVNHDDLSCKESGQLCWYCEATAMLKEGER